MKIFKGNVYVEANENEEELKLLSSKTMLWLGLGAIVFVPIFKTLTHLPPYIGMMLSLGFVWLVSEYIHPEDNFDKVENIYIQHIKHYLASILLVFYSFWEY